MTIIVACALSALAFGAIFVLALGRAAGAADADADRILAERRAKPAIAGYRQSYAGFARGHATITEPSSSASVGTQRLLHETFSVPSMPAWRWPGTEQ
jgi:hypothetical protein